MTISFTKYEIEYATVSVEYVNYLKSRIRKLESDLVKATAPPVEDWSSNSLDVRMAEYKRQKRNLIEWGEELENELDELETKIGDWKEELESR